MGALIGQLMKATEGKADGNRARAMLTERLEAKA